eukprot:TRINITY_DN60412_c0_g1_i2.p1 TRINITY_DN60412_c0_g1~~TRINITY_DN60412_c0_g1_i2.p1  ORF type:complete len:151 (-),score=40.29 TRINITY_DN60412_c0_g1_i2:88-540(-)
MLRSLVGSEMCIRDRYQRRVRGTENSEMVALVGQEEVQVLHKRWKGLREHIGNGEPPETDIWEKWFGVLESGYSEPERRYHTLRHLTEMFWHYDCVRDQLESPELVALAIWFHDLVYHGCLLYTSDAADEEDSVDLGGRRIIKKKKKEEI